MSLRSTCAGGHEGFTAVLCGPWRCHGAEEALDIVPLLCSDTLQVRLCRLRPASPRWTFWSLLGGEGGRLQGLTRGPESRPTPTGRGKLVFLCHAPYVTLLRKWPARPCLERGVWEPPSPDGSGLVFLCPGLGWHCKLGRSQGPSSSVSSIRSLRPGRTPSPEQGLRHAQAQSGFFVGGCARAYTIIHVFHISQTQW
jgi:hypothetical protein